MSQLRQITRWLSDIAAAAIAAMIFLTVADVLMKNIFNRPIKGTFELVEFLLVIVVFLGLAEVFRSDSNICVDVTDHMLSAGGRLMLRVFATVASLVFLLLMGWAMIAPAWDTVQYPQWTQEVGIPLYAYWAVIVVGTALTIAATVAVVVLRGREPSVKD